MPDFITSSALLKCLKNKGILLQSGGRASQAKKWIVKSVLENSEEHWFSVMKHYFHHFFLSFRCNQKVQPEGVITWLHLVLWKDANMFSVCFTYSIKHFLPWPNLYLCYLCLAQSVLESLERNIWGTKIMYSWSGSRDIPVWSHWNHSARSTSFPV